MEKLRIKSPLAAFCTFVLLFQSLESAKLNKPRVLLPLYSQFPNNFTLQVDDGGCYKWSTKSPSTIQLSVTNPVAPRGCSSEAVVSSVISEVGRHTAIIIAEDVSSGEVLRCDVIVDSISSLSIVTTTREIFIEEAPEVFEVQAYDDLGNQFTTLEGFTFNWNISTVSKRNKKSLLPTVIRVIKFADSHYKVPTASVAEIEDAGFLGNKVLLYGESTGQAEISVSLTQPQYQNVKPSPLVILAVVANLQLDPHETLLMPNTKVKYRLEVVKHGRQEQLRLPSEQYQLEVEKSAIAKLLSDGAIVEALTVGTTRVILRDLNAVDAEEGGRTPSAKLRVANPAALDIEVLPHKSWYLIVGQDYELHVSVYDSNRHVFHIGEGLDISIEINPEYFSNDKKTANVLFGRAQQIGIAPVIARLPNTKYTAQNQAIINEQVKVKPAVTYLPWSKTSHPYEIKLEASARMGDSSTPSFVWHSKTPRLASVDQEGMVTTLSSDLQVANISVALDKDPLNLAFAQVQFLPPTKLEIIGRVIQAEISTTLQLPISLTLQGAKEKIFKAADCRHIHFLVETDSGLERDERKPNGEPQGQTACTSIPLTSTTPLLTRVTVSLDMQLEDGNLLHLEDTATINFYKPLKVVHPESGLTILAPGSSRNIVFEGGPRAMTGQSQLSRKLLFTTSGLAQVWDLDKSSISYVLARVQCNKLGSTDLELRLEPKGGSSYVQARGTIKVICAMPDSITLTPNLPIPDFNTCMVSAGTYVTLSKHEVTVEAVAVDSNERRFDNFSSLNLEWSLEPQDLVAKLPSQMIDEVARDETYGIVLPRPSYHVIKPLGQSGELKISATLSAEKEKLSTQTIIHFLEEVQVNPSSLTVYNHTGKASRVKVSKGSSSFQLNILEGKDVADVKLVKARRYLEISPLKPGRARVSVVDGCLPKESRTAAIAEITVLGIGSVVISLNSQVQKGNTIEGTLVLLDTNGLQMSPPAAILVKHKADSKIKVKLSDISPLKFMVTGVNLGDAELVFVVDDVQSQPTSVHVFPPIKIWPSDLILVPGASMQALVKGGPKVPDAVLEFSSQSADRHVCLPTSTSGMMEARCVGTNSVKVKAIAPDGSVYSEDSAPVRIVSLSAVEIVVPTTVLEQGTKMPVYLQGKADTGEVITPYVLATIEAKCVWAEHGGRLHIKSSESLAYVDAINVGTAELSADLQLPDGTHFTSSASVDVVSALRLTLPPNAPSANAILIAPFSKVQLAATSGKFFMDCGGEGVISVSENGLVTSLGPLGRGTIVVSDHKTSQKLIVGITVVPIAYLMVQTNSPFPSSTFPRGMQSSINITYHDSIGREIIMPTNEREIDWISSKPHTLSLNQDRMQLGEPGVAVVDLWDKNIHAYFKLRVKQIILPVSLSQGDVVCYNVAHSGTWSSLSPSLLDINPTTGWAVALSPGDTNVNFESVEGASTWAEVQIHPATSIHFSTPDATTFSSKQALAVPVLIKSAAKYGTKKNNLIEGGCQVSSGSLNSYPIVCKAAWEDGSWDSTLQVKPSFDFRSGQYFCQVTTQSKEKTNKLVVVACLVDSSICTDKFSATFYSPIEINAKEINIKEQWGELVVKGPSQVLGKIRVEPTPELEIGYPKELSSESISIRVQLSNAFWSLPDALKYGSVLVKVLSPLTGQTFILPVVVDSSVHAPTCLNKPAAFSHIWDLLYSFRTEIIFSVCILIVISAVTNMYFTNSTFSNRTYSGPASPSVNRDDSPFMARGASNGNTSLTSTPLQPGTYPYTSHVYGNQDLSWHSSPGRR